MGKYSSYEVEKAINEYIQNHPQVDGQRYNSEIRRWYTVKEDYIFSWDPDYSGAEETKIDLKDLGILEFVETTPEDPGDGKYWGAVWKLDDQYFCKDGYYSSWDSSEFDGDFHEVKKVEKTITVWE